MRKGYLILLVSIAVLACSPYTVQAVIPYHVQAGILVKENCTIMTDSQLRTIPDGDDIVAIFTNSTESPPSGGVMLGNGVVVPGDVIIGPGGDVDVAIIEKKDAVIEGETYAAEDLIEFPSKLPPILSLGSWFVDPNDPTTATIYEDGRYDNLTLGSSKIVSKLFIHGDPTVNNGEVCIFVTGDVIIGRDAQIIVTGGSSLRLYIGGDLRLKNCSTITNEIIPALSTPTDQQIIAAASSIRIYGLNTCTSINTGEKTDIYGVVYAPEADINLYGRIYGGFLGKSITMKHSSAFFAIPSLLDEWWDCELDPNCI